MLFRSVPGGADWQYVRADNVTVVEARYLLRTDDDVLIEVHNRGIRHGPAETMKRLAAGESVDPGEYYFRATPVLSAPAGKYEWLNRSLFVCSGARYATAITPVDLSDSVKSGPSAAAFLFRSRSALIEGIPGVVRVATTRCGRPHYDHREPASAQCPYEYAE